MRWREWLRYVHVDQIWVWGLFCFVGMYLNVNLATAIIPHGTDLQGLAAGAYQAEYLAKIWPGFWFLTLFNGFWILFKTQLGNTDVLVRTTADAVWMAHPRVRAGLGIRVDLLRHPARCSRSGASSRSARPRRSSSSRCSRTSRGWCW